MAKYPPHTTFISNNTSSPVVPVDWRGLPVTTASNTNTNTNIYDIQGKMFAVNLEISDVNIQDNIIDPDSIKKQLMMELVKELFNSKYIEFTKQYNPSLGSHTFYARIYAVPDTQVRIIRTKT